MKIVAPILLAGCALLASQAMAQTETDSADAPKQKTVTIYTKDELRINKTVMYPRKHKFFVYWGYNRSAYTHSDLNFRGDGYNFTIKDVRATDGPTPLSADYVKPTLFTVPQFNYRVGYFLSDKSFVSFGSDHMKYTIAKQTTRLTGYINKGQNAGKYNNTEVEVGENCDDNNPGPSYIDNLPHGFVSNFEHCDGLNDFSAEVGRLEQVWISGNHKYAIAVTGSASAGMVIPDTDADVLGQPPMHDMSTGKKAYHLAGYSLAGTMGLQFDFLNRLYLQGKVKAGYINLPDILTTTEGGKASQHFNFIEAMVVLGYTFYL